MKRRTKAEWKAHDIEVARQNREHRCTNCRLNLSEAPAILENFLTPGKFCSEDCMQAFAERHAQEPRR